LEAPVPGKTEFRKFLLPWLMGLLGGALFGLAEAGRAIFASTSIQGHLAVSLLLGIGALSCALVGGAAGLLVGFALLRAGDGRRAWAAFLSGLSANLVWGITEWWLTAPPAFAVDGTFHVRGNPYLLGATLLLLVGGLVAVVWKLHAWRPMLAACALLALLLGVWTFSAMRRIPPRSAAHASSPNVLWVTLDTARADHFGAYGSGVRTPNFDRVAREGVLFRQAFAEIAVTGPSHTSMLTGTGPWTHGLLLNCLPLPDKLTTFPEVLRAEGYRTAAFVSAYVLGGEFGFARGFDVYGDDFSMLRGSRGLVLFRSIDALRRHWNPDLDVQRRGQDTVDEALDWMSRSALGGVASGKGPWLLWVHLYDPHGPYEPPPPFSEAYYAGNPKDPRHTSMEPVHDVAHYFKKSLQGVTDLNWVLAQYAGEVSYTDMQLGRLLGFLDDHALTDSTIVVVNADHGESLGDHDVWFDHGGNLYDPETHVPLAIRYPSGLVPAQVVDEPVELLDVGPTILALTGRDLPPTMEGRPLNGLLGGGQDRVFARGLCYDRVVNLRARAEGRLDRPVWRMVGLRGARSLFVRREAPAASDEYYDMESDPGQGRDLLAGPIEDTQLRELLALLKGQADRILDGMGKEARQRSEKQELSEEQAARLRALGYVD
jgi:arylsulfatase A-like enzyme